MIQLTFTCQNALNCVHVIMIVKLHFLSFLYKTFDTGIIHMLRQTFKFIFVMLDDFQDDFLPKLGKSSWLHNTKKLWRNFSSVPTYQKQHWMLFFLSFWYWKWIFKNVIGSKFKREENNPKAWNKKKIFCWRLKGELIYISAKQLIIFIR